jgi:hypothetical protein
MLRLIYLTAALLLATGAGCLYPTGALAQVPDHVPGTICFTPQFWCWADPPGPPGYPCGCPTDYGYVPGVLG